MLAKKPKIGTKVWNRKQGWQTVIEIPENEKGGAPESLLNNIIATDAPNLTDKSLTATYFYSNGTYFGVQDPDYELYFGILPGNIC